MLRNLLSLPAFVAVVALACAFATIGTATAHSRNEATIPADGATLAKAPDVIVMTFNRPIRITMVELTNSDGEAISLERSDGMEPVTRLEAIPPPLSAGSYSVRWRGLAGDGHPVSGGFTFAVQR